MESAADMGPGELNTSDIGSHTIARTTLLDARQIMAYAASINDANPAYFDDTREAGLAVHPAICFSLQWQARFRPDLEPNLRAAPYGVHAETDLRIHRPFRAGEAVTTQGRLVARRKIAPGVYTVERYRYTSSQGELIAELDYNGITRGATLDGPDVELAPSEPQPVPGSLADAPLWQEEVYIPLYAGQQYTECARIYNPIHTEPSVAKAAGLPDIILHGSATKAIALTHIINRCFDANPARITRLCGQLRGMVMMNSTIRIDCMGCEEVGAERRVYYRVLNATGEAAIANGLVTGTI